MSKNSTSSGIWDWQLVKLILGFAILFFVGIFALYGFTEDANREAIQWTGRFSFILFCIAFVASSFHLWIQNSFSFWVLMNRKYWGISFAIIHLIHLAFLGLLQNSFHPIFQVAETQALAAGSVAYLFIVLMLLTSFETFSKYLSHKQWKLLHTIGGYWVWGVFLSTYFKRTRTEIEHLPYVLILVFVLILRIWKLLRR